MREFVELLDLSVHACSKPSVERIEVYEPIRMEALWLTIFRCCAQVYSEPSAHTDVPAALRTLQARIEAA